MLDLVTSEGEKAYCKMLIPVSRSLNMTKIREVDQVSSGVMYTGYTNCVMLTCYYADRYVNM